MAKRRPTPSRPPKQRGGRGKPTTTQFVDDQGNVQTLTPVEQHTGPLTAATVGRVLAARYGRTLVPPTVAAAAAHAAPAIAGHHTLLVGLGGAALTGLTGVAGFRRPRWAAGWVAATTAVATLHTAVGYDRPYPLLTTSLLAGLTACWWLGHRNRPDAGTAFTLPERWAIGVGTPDKAMPGSRIIPSSLGITPVGVKFVVQLVPGKQTTSDAIGKTEKIASGLSVDGLDVDTADLVLEPTSPPNASRVAGLLVLDNPLHKITLWGGPSRHDVDTWTSTVGTYVDLAATTYRWLVEGSGPVPDLIGGASRSGKSRFLDLLLAISRHAFPGLIVDWVGDPQHGQSLPDWQGAVDWFAPGPDAVMDMLRAALAFAEWRNQLFANMRWVDARGRRRTGIKVMNPSIEHPMLVVTVDEAAVVLGNPEGVQILEDLAKLASKSLVKLRLAQQAVLLDQMKSNTLRSQLQAQGSIWSFKTDAQNAQSGFQGWSVNPAQLPAFWPDGSHAKGVGMTRSDDRQAFFRADLVEDPYDWASTGTTTHLGDDWLAVAPATYLKARGLPPRAPAPGQQASPGTAPTDGGPGKTQMTCRDAILQVLAGRGGRASTAEIGQGVYSLSGHQASTVSSKLSEMKGKDVRQPEGAWGVWELIQ